MNAMRIALTLAIAGLLLPAAAPAKGPGMHREAHLGRLPSTLTPGEPWATTIRIDDGPGVLIDAPAPGLTLIDSAGARHFETGRQTAKPGVYRVAFDDLEAGTYRLELDNGLGSVSDVRYVEIAAAAAGDDGPPVLAMGLGALALLGGLAALLIRRR